LVDLIVNPLSMNPSKIIGERTLEINPIFVPSNPSVVNERLASNVLNSAIERLYFVNVGCQISK
jgi:hypothetical protein